jgi:hypothetical protein
MVILQLDKPLVKQHINNLHIAKLATWTTICASISARFTTRSNHLLGRTTNRSQQKPNLYFFVCVSTDKVIRTLGGGVT